MNSSTLPKGVATLAPLILAIFCLCGVASAQGNDPKPQDATQAILTAFDKYEIVGMEAGHAFKDLDDYILSLISDPAFPDKVNDIVVECGNRLYQHTLDRYIAGDDVALAQVQPVWRNTTSLDCSVSSFYERLFPLVRQLNQKLPSKRRLRVVAADPPIDWDNVRNRVDYIAMERQRTSSITSVIMTEVLAKKRKALLLFGWGHLTHKGSRSSVCMYEKTYPGRTLVILPHTGFGSYNPLEVHNQKLESHMKSWPIPSLALIKGTWLADLDLTYYVDEISSPGVGHEITDLVDAYLYLGPRDSLSVEMVPAHILDDVSYVTELTRRADRAAEPFYHFNVERARHWDPRLYVPTTDPGWKTLGHGEYIPEAAMPLAKFVGTYAGPGLSIAVDMHQLKASKRAVPRPRGEPVYKLYARSAMFPKEVALASIGGNRFRSEGASHPVFVEFEVSKGSVSALIIEQGKGKGKPNVRLQWSP